MSEKRWAFEACEDSAHSLMRRIQEPFTPEFDFDLAVILGSGWGDAASLCDSKAVFDYAAWPCFPASTITGHRGQLLVGTLCGWKVLFFVGRFHCYQGLSAFQASFPVRLASSLGCRRLLATCATGGINPNYSPGDFMLVDDHLNLMGDNPLRGLAGDVFVDLSRLYAQGLYAKVEQRLESSAVSLHRGVLAALSGPSYETPAEIRMLSRLGADVVSMSTVPEAIMAAHLGMEVASAAFVSNYAAGLGPALSHSDVLDCGKKHSADCVELIRQMIECWQLG